MCRRSLSLIASNQISLVCTAVMGFAPSCISTCGLRGESQPDFCHNEAVTNAGRARGASYAEVSMEAKWKSGYASLDLSLRQITRISLALPLPSIAPREFSDRGFHFCLANDSGLQSQRIEMEMLRAWECDWWRNPWISGMKAKEWCSRLNLGLALEMPG
jgi:hypothetical protein